MPVFNQKTLDPTHVLEVASYQSRAQCHRMGSDSRVEILDPNPATLQVCLDLPKRATDLICPRDTRKLIEEHLKAIEQALASLGP